jgi:hypothetical protein
MPASHLRLADRVAELRLTGSRRRLRRRVRRSPRRALALGGPARRARAVLAEAGSSADGLLWLSVVLLALDCLPPDRRLQRVWRRRVAVGYADPGPALHSHRSGAYEQDGQDWQVKWTNLILQGYMNNLAGFAIRASR